MIHSTTYDCSSLPLSAFRKEARRAAFKAGDFVAFKAMPSLAFKASLSVAFKASPSIAFYVKEWASTPEKAMEEIIADSLRGVADRLAPVEMAHEAATKDTALGKLAARLKQWKGWVHRAINRVARRDSQTRRMLLNSEETLNDIAQRFQSLLRQTKEGREAGTLTRRSEGEARYSLIGTGEQKKNLSLMGIRPVNATNSGESAQDYDNNVPQNEKNSNGQNGQNVVEEKKAFSLSEPVEYTRDLVAVHNQSMRIENEKSLSSTLDEQAPDITPETLRGTAPNENIAEKGKNVNRQYSLSDNRQYSLNDTEYDKKEDIRFSLTDPVEYTRDLVAVHNQDERRLLEDLRMGAFPMPSIAVVKRSKGCALQKRKEAPICMMRAPAIAAIVCHSRA